MKQFYASHLEVKKYFSEDFETHPYEAGWADEAIFFIMVEEIKGESRYPMTGFIGPMRALFPGR